MSNRDIITEKLPTTKTGKRMLRRVSPIYSRSYVAKNIFEAIGIEWEQVWEYLQNVREQGFVCKCTLGFGIDAWEDRYSIPHNYDLDLQTRRDNIRMRRVVKYPLNPKRFEMLAEEASGIDINVDETFDYGVVGIEFDIDNDLSKIPYMFRVLRQEKPSHLSLKIVADILQSMAPSHEQFRNYPNMLDGSHLLNGAITLSGYRVERFLGYHDGYINENALDSTTYGQGLDIVLHYDFLHDRNFIANRLNSHNMLTGKKKLNYGESKKIVEHDVVLMKGVPIEQYIITKLPELLDGRHIMDGSFAMNSEHYEKYPVEHTAIATILRMPTMLDGKHIADGSFVMNSEPYEIGGYVL